MEDDRHTVVTAASALPAEVGTAAGLRVEDVVRAPAVVADFRKVIRQDPRIIQKLHRRVFVDKLTRDQARPTYPAINMCRML